MTTSHKENVWFSSMKFCTDLGSRAQMGEDPRVLFGLQAGGGFRPRCQGASDAACALSRVQAHHQDKVFAQVCKNERRGGAGGKLPTYRNRSPAHPIRQQSIVPLFRFAAFSTKWLWPRSLRFYREHHTMRSAHSSLGMEDVVAHKVKGNVARCW